MFEERKIGSALKIISRAKPGWKQTINSYRSTCFRSTTFWQFQVGCLLKICRAARRHVMSSASEIEDKKIDFPRFWPRRKEGRANSHKRLDTKPNPRNRLRESREHRCKPFQNTTFASTFEKDTKPLFLTTLRARKAWRTMKRY